MPRAILLAQIQASGPGAIATAWLRLTGEFKVQVTGTASSADVVVECSTRNPFEGPANAAPAEEEPWHVSPRAGAMRLFRDPGAGWWRARRIDGGGDAIFIDISGQAA